MENIGKGTHSTKMGADSLAENTPNASKHFSPKCLPKPKSSQFLKKGSLWVSVVRGVNHLPRRLETHTGLWIRGFLKVLSNIKFIF